MSTECALPVFTLHMSHIFHARTECYPYYSHFIAIKYSLLFNYTQVVFFVTKWQNWNEFNYRNWLTTDKYNTESESPTVSTTKGNNPTYPTPLQKKGNHTIKEYYSDVTLPCFNRKTALMMSDVKTSVQSPGSELYHIQWKNVRKIQCLMKKTLSV